MRITYEIITPESAENGDAAECGFVEPQFKLQVPLDEVNANAIDWPSESLEWSLRDAEVFLGRGGMEDSGRWFTSCDPSRDFQTGSETFYSLHPDNVTPATYERLKRVFCR